MLTNQKTLDRSIDEFGLSVRTYNCLRKVNIQTIGDLVQKTEAEMLRIKNFGRKSLNELNGILSGLSLSFGMKIKKEDNRPKSIDKLEKSMKRLAFRIDHAFGELSAMDLRHKASTIDAQNMGTNLNHNLASNIKNMHNRVSDLAKSLESIVCRMGRIDELIYKLDRRIEAVREAQFIPPPSSPIKKQPIW